MGVDHSQRIVKAVIGVLDRWRDGISTLSQVLVRKLHPHSTLPISFWGFRNSPESLVRIHYWRIPGFFKHGKKKPKIARNFPPRVWTKKQPFSTCTSVHGSQPSHTCESLQNSFADHNGWSKPAMPLHRHENCCQPAAAINLSLIHIWRCRRIERCRSRWSPYH